MTDAQGKKLQEMAAQQAQYGAGLTQGSAAGCGTIGKAAGASLLERINDRLYQAQAEGRRAEKLGELKFLLDKNPETARILELLEILEQR